ncbi:glycerophosphodiester phosphodiesterase [Alkalicoccus daliensis]|uniref:Glycerophosphoryl diester phosphodiesterase n=1 Tax=Alkalicoccus daliensis TaxID=745820 RepID=A0A1H0BBL3_9BACI|nr:glycerophosphodiester phosphodiesterase family protein [Alkalicoccus daliensis]SDN43017.1 glycerophosphoryl diester phosphodiesterase [Alkalicoccus daliensis]
MDIIGHRGFKRLYPENTMVGFKAASAFSIDGIECDVHWTKDEVPVIIHDAELERTTNGRGRVADHTWEELQLLDAGSYFDKKFKGEKIPSLRELAQWLQENNLTLHLELKEQLHTDNSNFVLSCISLLREHSLIRRTIISTFYHSYIREIKRQEPLLQTALLTKTPFRRGKKYANKVAADGIHIRHGVQASMYYGPWRRQGLTVRAYNVKRKQDYLRCLRAGVSGIITDDPEQMAELKFDRFVNS